MNAGTCDLGSRGPPSLLTGIVRFPMDSESKTLHPREVACLLMMKQPTLSPETARARAQMHAVNGELTPDAFLEMLTMEREDPLLDATTHHNLHSPSRRATPNRGRRKSSLSFAPRDSSNIRKAAETSCCTSVPETALSTEPANASEPAAHASEPAVYVAADKIKLDCRPSTTADIATTDVPSSSMP